MGSPGKLNTEERILFAAKRVFMSRGMAGARMQDIADEAGINKAMLHYYFRNKEKLFEKVFEISLLQFLPGIRDILESDEPLFKKIHQFCNLYISHLSENPFLPIFIINEVNKQPDRFLKKIWGRRVPQLNIFTEQVSDEIRNGRIKKTEPLQLFMNMLSLCIFPFLSKPLLQRVGGIDETRFSLLMEQRKKEVSKFIIESIKI